MNRFVNSFNRRWKRLHRSADATALTEFVITLPVFLLFMSGIITLYELQQQALFTHQESVSELWEDAVAIQTTGLAGGAIEAAQTGNFSNFTHLSSATGFVSVEDFYSDLNQSTGGFNFDTSDVGNFVSGSGPPLIDYGAAFGGMHFDSGMKTTPFHAASLTPSNWSDNDWPHYTVEQISDGSAVQTLMQDRANATGIGDSIPASLNSAGVVPGLAAGIRYGVAGGVEELERTHQDSMRDYAATSLTGYNTSAPTYPSERLAAVFFSWDHVRKTDGYDKMIGFGMSPSNMGSGADSSGDVDDLIEESDECVEEMEDYNDCIQPWLEAGAPQFVVEADCGSPPECMDGDSELDNCINDLDWDDIDDDGSDELDC